MSRGPEMPSRPRSFTGVFHIFFGLFLILTLCTMSLAQEQSPKTAEKPVPQVFPSAVPEAAPPTPELSKTTDESGSGLRLGAGDLLEVSVYNVPELGTKSRVGNSGDVYLPLIDYVHLAGLTIEEAQGLIEKKLSDGGF